MIKYIDKININYGAMFFTDDDELCYSALEAAEKCSKSFAIINPLAPNRINNFKGKIWKTYEEFPQLAKVRRVFVSEDRKSLLREYFSIHTDDSNILCCYDYDFLFDEKIPNLVGKKIYDHGEIKTLNIMPPVLPYRYYSSPREYLDYDFESRRDIYAQYSFAEDEWWYNTPTHLLYRRVKEYEKKQGG